MADKSNVDPEDSASQEIKFCRKRSGNIIVPPPARKKNVPEVVETYHIFDKPALELNVLSDKLSSLYVKTSLSTREIRQDIWKMK